MWLPPQKVDTLNLLKGVFIFIFKLQIDSWVCSVSYRSYLCSCTSSAILLWAWRSKKAICRFHLLTWHITLVQYYFFGIMAFEILVYLVSWEITLFLLFLSFLKKKKKEIIRKSLAVTSSFNTSENWYVWFTLPNMFW